MAYSESGFGGGALVGRHTTFVNEIVDQNLGYAQGPVRSLMAAILFDGIQAYMNFVYETSNGREPKRYREAYKWVHDQKNGYIFSFDNVCEGLGIEPDWLRLGLANATQSKAVEFRKSRRTSL